MKKYIIILIFAFGNILSIAQTGAVEECWNTINTISSFGDSDQSLNSWNWTSEIFNSYRKPNSPY